MPYPPQVYATTGHAFGLTVSGVQVIENVPTSLAPIRWSRPGWANNGGCSFVVEDTGATPLPLGSVVRLTDNDTGDLLSSGVLLRKNERRGAGSHRWVACDVVGWGYFLDQRAVTTFTYPTGLTKVTLASLLAGFGGPVQAAPLSEQVSGDVAGSTTSKSSVRSVVDAIIENSTSVQTYTSGLGIFDNPTSYDPLVVRYLVDDNALLYTYVQGRIGDPATVPTIGVDGTLQPDTLTVEYGADGTKHFANAYGATSGFEGVAPNTLAAAWDAGATSSIYDSPTRDGGSAIVEATGYLRVMNSEITSMSFTTIEAGGWQPGQRVELVDSVMGSAAFFVESVDGVIDHRNVVEYTVSTGAPARSLVQTVAGL